MIVKCQHEYILQMLPMFLEYTTLVNVALNGNNDTAMMMTCKYCLSTKNRLEVTKMLLAAGADIFLRNKGGQTVMDMIIKMELDLSKQENRDYVDMISTSANCSCNNK